MLVDVVLGDEPRPDAAEDLDRLAEEERRLAVVLEHEGGQEAGRREEVPDGEDSGEQRELPEAKVLHGGVVRTKTVASRTVGRPRPFVGQCAEPSARRPGGGGVV